MSYKLTLSLLIIFVLAIPFDLFSETEISKPPQEKKVKLTWEDVKGAVSYKIMLKDSSGEIIINTDADSNSVIVEAVPGKYKLRIGSVNKFNKIWDWSRWEDIEIESPSPGTEDKNEISRMELAEKLKKQDSKKSDGPFDPSIRVSFEGNYILPLGKFADINTCGYGGMLYLLKLFGSFEAGLASGYWQFNGVSNVDSSFVLPALFSAGYNIRISSLSVAPRISGGVSYNRISYRLGNNSIQTNSGIEPLILFGAAFNYNISSRFSLFLNTDLGNVIEPDNFFPFALFGAGLSFNF